jgi:hypothetical protein
MTIAAWVFMIASMAWSFFKLLTLPAASAADEPACPAKPGSGDKPS